MTAREYLLQLKRLNKNIRILHEEIERRRAKLESTSVPLRLDRVQSSGKGDSLADGIAILADKSIQYDELLYIYEHLREEIVRKILGLSSPVHSDILYKRYVEEKAWPKIAGEMYFSEAYIYKLHVRALIDFAETWQVDSIV